MTGVDTSGLNQDILEYLYSGYIYLETGLFGFFFGTIFYFIYWLTESTRIRNYSFGRIMAIKTVLYCLGFVTVFALVFLILSGLGITPIHNWEEVKKITHHQEFAVGMFSYIILFTIIINFLLEVSKKFGPGNLWLMMSGKYHHPVVENRIFMFLDLKDSTSYAEKLGHIKYSQLIQKCFLYLNDIVFEHRAQIYQYVGDEVVLTWNMNDSNAVNNAVNLYFEFQRKLQSQSSIFEERFGFTPEFKAGINEGKVTAAEVGNFKREIAYHGDVLNTGARIQAKCNEFGKKLLVSEIFANQLNGTDHFKKERMGKINLKGKQEAIEIYAIEMI